MVVLSAAVCTKAGKGIIARVRENPMRFAHLKDLLIVTTPALVARQFVEVSRIRIEVMNIWLVR